MDTDKIKIYGARAGGLDGEGWRDRSAEKRKMEDKCERIANHRCNLFINRQLIYNYPEQVLMNKGVTSIEHADFDGVEASLVTGEICSTFGNASENVLGTYDLVEEIMIGGQADQVLRRRQR